MTQRPKLLQLVAINSLGYVVVDLSLRGSARGTVSFLSYPVRRFLWADRGFLGRAGVLPPLSLQVSNNE